MKTENPCENPLPDPELILSPLQDSPKFAHQYIPPVYCHAAQIDVFWLLPFKDLAGLMARKCPYWEKRLLRVQLRSLGVGPAYFAPVDCMMRE